jgi:hypothetical protein
MQGGIEENSPAFSADNTKWYAANLFAETENKWRFP